MMAGARSSAQFPGSPQRRPIHSPMPSPSSPPHARPQARPRLRRRARGHAGVARPRARQVLNAAEAYERAIAWKDAVAGASNQAAGTRQQQASQALFVATGEARYKREWEQGVAIAERSGAAVEKLNDPPITELADGDRGRPQARRVRHRPALPGDGARRHRRRPRRARRRQVRPHPAAGAGEDRRLRQRAPEARHRRRQGRRPPPRAASASSPACWRRSSPR